ncbi:RNA polymerase factor sigma-54 [Limnobacter humi]|uniref:RNA polymerase sigma-54 factor n=1 Tax=Limnobacter humi TaxID=1778671 RepID=A0ABT1WIT5_9BURK|nr:RNA polymerase factor sigma-54 [Limnobacter humi]MCQ8897438.1 RNA polymerase factor sigma-54 [Limnobacter humi]
MKQSLQLKVSQNLTLTPQLQQSIRLLQLSTLELQQEIQQALAENPLLEVSDEDGDENGADQTVSLGANSELDDTPTDSFDPGETEPARAEPVAEQVQELAPDADRDGEDQVQRDSIDAIQDNWEGDWRDNSGTHPDGDEEKPGLQLAAPESSLSQHLIDQLRMTNASERDKNLVLWLIDYLNDDGYLTVELEDLWDTLQEVPDLEFEELQAALKLLQSFDPPGVGARNASECLLLQLKTRQHLANDTQLFNTCRLIISEHLSLLAQRDYTKLKKALNVDEELLKECHQLIRSLEPFPGAKFRRVDDDHVVPDVIVRKSGGKWHVQLNPDVMPRIRINEVYAAILRSNRGQSAQLSAQLQEARWLLKNVQQRFDTILRVSQAIVERQIGYFNHGEIAMQPLVLREIADLLGLHESTVSRVTTQKYMLTPHGLVELKYFFGSHVSTDSGGQASSTAIRALIKQLISSEDPKQPISDSQIAELLGQQGIVVARRTVAKYRESLKIPPVNMRKSL